MTSLSLLTLIYYYNPTAKKSGTAVELTMPWAEFPLPFPTVPSIMSALCLTANT